VIGIETAVEDSAGRRIRGIAYVLWMELIDVLTP
jgi:hypothetical protein